MTTISAILQSDDLEGFERDGPLNPRLPLEMKGLIGHDQIATQPRPGVFQTHLWPEMLPDDIFKKNIKIIRVIRNPKDVAVSYFHFTQAHNALGSVDCTWEQYLNAFMAGDVAYGSYFEHYNKWLNFRNHTNVMCVNYEEYIKDPCEVITKLSIFLGKPLENDAIMQLVRMLSFACMKDNTILNKETPHMKKNLFMRKGVVGDWKNYFTNEQNKKFDAVCDQFMQETGYSLTFE